MPNLEKRMVLSRCASSPSECWFRFQRYTKKSEWNWTSSLQFYSFGFTVKNLEKCSLNFFILFFIFCLSFFGTSPEQHHILKLRVRYSNSIHSLWLSAYRMCMEATLVDNDLHYRCAIVIHGMQSCHFVGG